MTGQVLNRSRCALLILLLVLQIQANGGDDFLRELQRNAAENNQANWGHWGTNKRRYAQTSQHSNRLIPVYTYGIDLSAFKGRNSLYRRAGDLRKLYGYLPDKTLNSRAEYFDQTDVYRLQWQAVNSGKKYIVLLVFDGLDWQLAQAAAIYKTRKVAYSSGRGKGLSFQNHKVEMSDFGFCVTSPQNAGTRVDVNGQFVRNPGGIARGGYFAQLGGTVPLVQVGERPLSAGQASTVRTCRNGFCRICHVDDMWHQDLQRCH